MDVSSLLSVFTTAMRNVQREMSENASSDIVSRTLTPFLSDLNKCKVMLVAHGDSPNTANQIRKMLSSYDSQILSRLRAAAATDIELKALESVLTDQMNSVQQSVPATTFESQDTQMEFKLLKTVSAVINEDTSDAPGKPAPESPAPNTIKVPSSVINSIKSKIAELEKEIEQKVARKDKDWTVYVPVSAAPDAEMLRTRIGIDRAVEMLEMMLAHLSGSPTTTDLKQMIIKYSGYDNLTRHHVPDDVLQFMLVSSRWESTKTSTPESKEVE